MKQYSSKEKLFIVRGALNVDNYRKMYCYKRIALNYQISLRTLQNWIRKALEYVQVSEQSLENKSKCRIKL